MEDIARSGNAPHLVLPMKISNTQTLQVFDPIDAHLDVSTKTVTTTLNMAKEGGDLPQSIILD